MISFRTAMFSFREFYFRLLGLFDWGYTRMQFPLSVSRNRYDFTLAGYGNGKSATDPALSSINLSAVNDNQCLDILLENTSGPGFTKGL